MIFTLSTVAAAAAVACGETSTPSGDIHARSSPASAGNSPAASAEAERGAGAAGATGSPDAVDAPSSSGKQANPDADRCDGVECPEDQFCDLQSVRCVRAPCPAVPMCITGMHPCAVTTCITGSRCESHDGQAVCVPIPGHDGGSPCGSATCEPGMVCCNASCGICTPPDGACTQQACE